MAKELIQIIKDSKPYKSGYPFSTGDIASLIERDTTRASQILLIMQQDGMVAKDPERRGWYVAVNRVRYWLTKPWRKHSNEELGITEQPGFC